MNVLILGGGGREHALAKRLKIEQYYNKIFVYPGNDGIFLEGDAEPFSSKPGRQMPAGRTIAVPGTSFLELLRKHRINTVVSGSEEFLNRGTGDFLMPHQIHHFGPTKKDARTETSKIWATEFRDRHKIPSPPHTIITASDLADFDKIELKFPLYLKPDGLTGGKGVERVDSREDVLRLAGYWIQEKKHRGVVLEEAIEGEELSVMYAIFKNQAHYLGAAHDYKSLYEGGAGPNTGGMGCVSPHPFLTSAVLGRIEKEVLVPTIAGFRKERMRYTGFLYLGLMLTRGKILVLEYNARFGDPEAQVILPLLPYSLSELIEGGRRVFFGTVSGSAFCYVLAAPGYPEAPRKGIQIQVPRKIPRGSHVIYAGVKKRNGRMISTGGRVLGIVARAPDPAGAKRVALSLIHRIVFPGGRMRRDIGDIFHSRQEVLG